MKHKFGAIKVKYDGINFPSTLEGNYYLYLTKMQKLGNVLFFLRQVPFHLPGNVTLRVDFQVFWGNGDITFEDTKGMLTKDFIMKKKMVETIYRPVEILVVTKIPTF